MKNLKDIQEHYDLQFNEIEKQIKSSKAKRILLQFPDGLKSYSLAIENYLKTKFPNVDFLIWFGTCYGACDTPILPKDLEKKIDLTIQFGHSELQPQY